MWGCRTHRVPMGVLLDKAQYSKVHGNGRGLIRHEPNGKLWYVIDMLRTPQINPTLQHKGAQDRCS